MKSKLPNIENGYELGADRYGYFSIVKPEERTVNYIKNACFYSNNAKAAYHATGDANQPCDIGYYTINATITPKDRVLSLTGAGAKITPVDAAETTMSLRYITESLPAGTYTFSAYYSGEVSNEFLLQVFNSGQSIQYGETARHEGGGMNGFQRLYVTFTIPVEMTVELKLTQLADSNGKLSVFYTDMWQLENKPYVTLPFLGHNWQYMHDNSENAFSWSGAPYYSESIRTEKSYESGREIDLSELGFRLTGIIGLGVQPIIHNINQVASGGGVYDSTTNDIRTFTLVGRIYGRDMQDILTKRRDIYELIRPVGRNTDSQPTTLLFRIWDCEKKKWVGQPIYIYCRYTSGLEGAIDSESGEDITITFTSEDPFVYSSYIKNYDITPKTEYTQLEADTNNVSPIFLLKDKYGQWIQPDLRLLNTNPTDLCKVKNTLPDGTGGYFVYGNFETAINKGISTTVNGVFRYNPTTESASACGDGVTKGVTGGTIYRMIVLPSGDAIAVGDFTSAGGVADTACIALYKPGANAWHSISAGISAWAGYGPLIRDVEYGADNKIYVSGIFENIGGASPEATCLARMNLNTQEWEEVPIARTQYIYPRNGMYFMRLYRQRYTPGYENKPVTGFISGDIMTFATPYTTAFIYWDGSETFYTNWRPNRDWNEDNSPDNPSLLMQAGVINQNTGSIYISDGNGYMYKVDFVMPDYKQEIVGSQLVTTYTHPERNSPSIWKRLKPPFSRKVLVDPDGHGFQSVPVSRAYMSEHKMLNDKLVISPTYSYGLDGFEIFDPGIPVDKVVPVIWYHNTWHGAVGESSGTFYPYEIYAREYAYTAAFHIDFLNDEAFVAVNTGHIFPVRAGDNIINAIVSGTKVVENNGENVSVHFLLGGALSVESFTNQTSEQNLYVDGYRVAEYEEAHIITLPKYTAKFSLDMHRHYLDNSDANLKLVPGKNIMSCKMNDISGNGAKVSLIFRERYASISKAIEYVGG